MSLDEHVPNIGIFGTFIIDGTDNGEEVLDKQTSLKFGTLETSTEQDDRTALEGNGLEAHKVPSVSL